VTVTVSPAMPAALGGAPAFAPGLALTELRVPRRQELQRRLDQVLDSGRLTNGPLVRELEERAAELLGVPHVVAVASCTSGLMLVLRSLEVAGRVAMPSFTFSATAHAAAWAGARPRWVEVDAATLTTDPGDLGAHLEGCTAVMATHVYGTPCAVEELAAVTEAAGLPLLYDAAHALGSRRGGVPVGCFGAAEVFSLSPSKVATAAEGGLVATRDGALAEQIRIGRDYGNPGDYDCRFVGLNARMSELHAAVGLTFLADLEQRVARRGELARLFQAATGDVPGLRFPAVDPADRSTFKDLTILADPAELGMTADQLAWALAAEGVDTRRYFYPPVHRQQAYRSLPHERDLPVTDLVAGQVLTLPLWAHMTDGTMRRLADTVIRLQEWAARLVRAAP
jgi:dTDP-4-amino-4,6-dideoxygalactose transaminase